MARRGIACDDSSTKCERSYRKRRVARFFKIMFGRECSEFMYLPPEFARRQHLTIQETQIEDLSGQRWSVTLSFVNGSLAFQMGWQKFFRDHGLKEGHLLVFSYLEESHFTVRIFATSACEIENFNNEMANRSKKRRRDQGTASEDEPKQTADVNSRDESISASDNEIQNRLTNLAVENAGIGSEILPISVNIEDPTCMINRSDGYYEEHRNLLYDLSSFEMENRSDVNKFQGAIITMSDPPHTETEQHDVNLENASDTKISLSCNKVLEPTNLVGDDAMKQTKTTAEGAQMAAIKTDLITSNTGDISIGKFGTALDAKIALSHTEITDHIKYKVDDTQMAPHSHQAGGHSWYASMKKFCEKSSDSSKVQKGMFDNVCNFQDESFSVSPSIGSSKIAEREHVVKSKFGEFSVSSSAVKNPLGLHVVKKEVEMEDKANVFHQVPCGGKEPPTVWNRHQMISPPVKVEPDLLDETGQMDTINPISTSPFLAEVKSPLYLELPVQIISARGRKLRALTMRAQTMRAQMIVFLRDSVQRLWPVVYREYFGGRALIVNWTQFCEQNNIKPGDKCRFQVEYDPTSFIFRVDVVRGPA